LPPPPSSFDCAVGIARSLRLLLRALVRRREPADVGYLVLEVLDAALHLRHPGSRVRLALAEAGDLTVRELGLFERVFHDRVDGVELLEVAKCPLDGHPRGFDLREARRDVTGGL